MIFEQVATGGCQSYLVGCPDTLSAALIDPEVRQIDRYSALVARDGLHIRYVIDTHTHADHFSASKQLGETLGVPVVMHRAAPEQFANLRLDEGDMLRIGNIRLRALHTPGHTADSMSLVADDRVFTGDALLIGGAGRTDLPTGNAEQLYESLFEKLLKLPPDTLVYPAHDYKGRSHSTIGAEIKENPRLQAKTKAEFVKMMGELNLALPDHLTEALRTNISGGKTVGQMLSEAAAAVPFMSLEDVRDRASGGPNDFVILDVREAAAFEAGHIPGARHLPRGQLELRINEELPDPTVRVVTVCEYGKISTLAAATLRELGYMRAAALDGGMNAWREGDFPLQS